jgi:hypothetical protein
MTLADGAGSYAGPLGLLVILLLFAATVLLIRNMTARIKRLPDSFESTDTDPNDPDDLAA